MAEPLVDNPDLEFVLGPRAIRLFNAGDTADSHALRTDLYAKYFDQANGKLGQRLVDLNGAIKSLYPPTDLTLSDVDNGLHDFMEFRFDRLETGIEILKGKIDANMVLQTVSLAAMIGLSDVKNLQFPDWSFHSDSLPQNVLPYTPLVRDFADVLMNIGTAGIVLPGIGKLAAGGTLLGSGLLKLTANVVELWAGNVSLNDANMTKAYKEIAIAKSAADSTGFTNREEFLYMKKNLGVFADMGINSASYVNGLRFFNDQLGLRKVGKESALDQFNLENINLDSTRNVILAELEKQIFSAANTEERSKLLKALYGNNGATLLSYYGMDEEQRDRTLAAYDNTDTVYAYEDAVRAMENLTIEIRNQYAAVSESTNEIIQQGKLPIPKQVRTKDTISLDGSLNTDTGSNDILTTSDGTVYVLKGRAIYSGKPGEPIHKISSLIRGEYVRTNRVYDYVGALQELEKYGVKDTEALSPEELVFALTDGAKGIKPSKSIYLDLLRLREILKELQNNANKNQDTSSNEQTNSTPLSELPGEMDWSNYTVGTLSNDGPLSIDPTAFQDGTNRAVGTFAEGAVKAGESAGTAAGSIIKSNAGPVAQIISSTVVSDVVAGVRFAMTNLTPPTENPAINETD